MTRLQHPQREVLALLALPALLVAPAALRAQASGVLQAQVRVLEFRPQLAIAEAWKRGLSTGSFRPLRLHRPGQSEQIELQALPDSGATGGRRLRLTVTYLR